MDLQKDGDKNHVLTLSVGRSAIPVYDIEEESIKWWTLDDVLAYINADRSDGWTDYNESDWVEGWKEWVEGDGIWSIPQACLRPNYFTEK